MRQVQSYRPSHAERLRTSQEKVINAYLAALRALRVQFNLGVPFQPPYPANKAEQAFRLLDMLASLLGRVGRTLTPELLHEKAVVVYKPPQPNAEVAKWLDDYRTDKAPEGIPYLLIKAQAQPSTPQGLQEAFRCYDAINSMAKANEHVSPEQRIKMVLEPGIEKGDLALRLKEPGEGFRKRLAALYLDKVLLIRVDRRLEEIVILCESAIKVFPDPEMWMQCSQAHLELANGPTVGPLQRKRLLQMAVQDAEAALKYDHPDKARVHDQKGLALEDIAWFRQEKRWDEAIQAFTDSINGDNKNGKHWMDRGRCYCKRAEVEQKPNYYENARKDLDESLGPNKEISGDLRTEAWFWLEKVYLSRPKPAPDQAQNCIDKAVALAEKQTIIEGSYLYVLMGLVDWAEYLLAKEGIPERLDKAADSAVKLDKFASKCADKDKQEYYSFYAPNLIKRIGLVYETGADPVAALKMYRRGLLDGQASTAPVSKLRLLNQRNLLFLKRDFRKKLKRPLLFDRDVKRALVLAESDHVWITAEDRADAYVAAALLANEDGDPGVASDYFRKAVHVPGLEGEYKKRIETIRETDLKAGR
jgi:tetratricopeptide (TPR) repeat protein